MTTITENGVARKVTTADTFLLHLAKQGLEGHRAAARGTLSAIALGQATTSKNFIYEIIISLVAPGNPNHVVVPIGMACKLHAFRSTARTVLEP
jgi:hypothetical protein